MCVTALDPPSIEGEKQCTSPALILEGLSAVCEPGLGYRGHLLKVLPELWTSSLYKAAPTPGKRCYQNPAQDSVV